jgi:hypothetical protein
MVVKSMKLPSSDALDANQNTVAAQRQSPVAGLAGGARTRCLQQISIRLDPSSDGKAIAFRAGTLLRMTLSDWHNFRSGQTWPNATPEEQNHAGRRVSNCHL